ncbi:hypothetical protein N7526_001220 [Penicillium atrosanguineum]|nr:hypothetical protein N7526_001220 [Penicillium atrosanguineum]
MFSFFLASFLFISGATAKKHPFQFEDDDYIQYRTLPDHRIVKWNITHYDRSAIAPGYLFTAPYWTHDGDAETDQWVPYQMGPHIFDQDGVRVYSRASSIVSHTDYSIQVLVWAGSAESDNRPSFDFRVIDLATPGSPGSEPQQALAWMLFHEHFAPETNGSVIIFDSNYNHERTISIPSGEIDTHDFNVIDNGSKALMIRVSRDVQPLIDFGQPEKGARIDVNGFIEIDLLAGGNTTAEARTVDWQSPGRVGLDESFVTNLTYLHPDFMHANAIDKNQYGDYLLSARHTSTIYLISGQDGHIIWRLGGKKNNFAKDFDFFGQHDARFIAVNETHYVISFLQNGAIDANVQEPVSSALYVELDIVAMKATILRRYMRPDGGSTERRGNMQTLPNTNVFVGWSWDSYISEFRPMAESYGVNGSELSTVFHVSWNGATDIEYWRFFAQANSTSNRTEIGIVQKEGFETSFIARGFMDWVSVEALDSSMEVLGASSSLRTPRPKYWTGETLPKPDDPETFLVAYSIKAAAPRDTERLVGIFIAGLFSSAVVWTFFWYRHTLKRYGLRCYSNAVLASAGYLPVSTTGLNSPNLERRDAFSGGKS